MVSAPSDLASVAPISLKMVIAGGFGVGKTTTVASISEIEPLTTEAAMTEVAGGIALATFTPANVDTTVALDFGRITFDDLVLYLFGTPGQERFSFMWDELARGAIGAIVIADTRRIADSFPALDYFEARGIPFVVGVNTFDGLALHTTAEVYEAIAVSPDIPVVFYDARDRDQVKSVLVTLVEHALGRARVELVGANSLR